MSVKDKIGTWQNNAYVYKSPHAYKTVKNLLGGCEVFFFLGLRIKPKSILLKTDIA